MQSRVTDGPAEAAIDGSMDGLPIQTVPVKLKKGLRRMASNRCG